MNDNFYWSWVFPIGVICVMMVLLWAISGCSVQPKVPDPGYQASQVIKCHYFNRKCNE